MTEQPGRGKKKTVKADIPQKRAFRTQSLAEASRPLLKPILGRRGFSAVEIVTGWPSIVGERIARYCAPVKLARPRFEGHEGVLHIRAVSGGFALELQHLEPQILDRVNAYFGYRAIGKLAITQGPLPERPSNTTPVSPATPPTLPMEEKLRLDDALAAISNPDLRAALAGLGARVLTENAKKKGT